MSIRLIAIDLDGTLLGGTSGRYGFLPAGVAALRKAASRQTAVAIVTGRDPAYIFELLAREGISPVMEGWPHVIVAEERFIYRLRDGQYVPDAEWNEAIFYAERLQFERIRQGVNALLAEDIAKVDAGSYRVEGEVEEKRCFVEVRFTDAEYARAAETILTGWLKYSRLPYATARNVAGIAIRHSSVGKGALLYKVSEELNISPSEVLAIGDSSNDLSMLDGRFGFIGTGPGNAEAEVRDAIGAQGGFIAASPYGDGVAEAIAHYMK